MPQLVRALAVEVEALHCLTPDFAEAVAANRSTQRVREQQSVLAELEESNVLGEDFDKEVGNRDCAIAGLGLRRSEVGHSSSSDTGLADPGPVVFERGLSAKASTTSRATVGFLR